MTESIIVRPEIAGVDALSYLNRATADLQRARDIREVKDIRDKAEAMRMYAAQVSRSLEAQNICAEVKLRAERRAGEMIAQMPKQNGDPLLHDVTRVEDLGISRNQSSRWQSIAGIPEAEFEDYIASANARARELTTSGALKLAKTITATSPQPTAAPSNKVDVFESVGELVATDKKFGCVYADPPWQYGNQATRASTDNHYGTMPTVDICKMPVASVVADDAFLHLWTTNAFLFESKAVMEAWGFEYKSCFIWAKPQMGIGNYWRVSHEFMLLGMRGKPKWKARDEKSWREIPRGAHSAKPEEIRLLIEKCCDGPYLEIFGRRTAPGWSVVGNQVERSMYDECV